MRAIKFHVFSMVLFSLGALADNNTYLTYQGRLTKPDGTFVNSSSLIFTIQIVAPNNCVIWEETLGATDLSSSKGAFTVTVGSGANTATGTIAWADVFQNGKTLSSLSDSLWTGAGTCAGAGGSYTGGTTDDRSLYARFNDGSGIQTIGPVAIRSAPYTQKANAANGAFRFLQLTNAEETTMVLGFVPVIDDGRFWYNSSLGTMRYYQGGVVYSMTTTAYAPSGGAGAIQFNNGGSFSSDAANFFWDDISNRLGLGTGSPGATLHVVGSLRFIDGNQGINKVLTSDASGNATWQTATVTSFTGSLAGDVSGTQGATSVDTVGGKTASAVATSVNDTQAASNANTSGTIVRRDGSGNFSAGTITASSFVGNLTGNITGNASTATALAANPSDCAGGSFATAIDAFGNLTCNSVGANAITSGMIVDNTIMDVDVNVSANISVSKLGTGAVDNTEFNYLDGVTSPIQAQLANKVSKSGDTMTGHLTMDNQRGIIFREQVGNGTESATIIAPDAIGTSFTLKLPSSVGVPGQILSTDGTGNLAWSAAVATALSNGHIFVGSVLNVAQDVPMSGDIGIDSTGNTTIQNNSVTTIKINNGAVTAAKLDSTGANGELFIGNGAGFTKASLTAGAGVTITPGAGSITIAATAAGESTSVSNVGTGSGIYRDMTGSQINLKTILGTANQVTVTSNANDLTLSLPQSIHSGASPTFTGLTLSGMSSAGFVKNSAAGVLSGGNSINLAAEVGSSVLPIANGGTSNGSLGVTNGGIIYTDGSKLMNSGAGTSGQVLTSGGAGAPTWTTATSANTASAIVRRGTAGEFNASNITSTTVGTSTTPSIATATPDFNQGMQQTTSYDCAGGNLTPSNLNDGGTYMLAVTSTTTAQCTFAGGLTYVYNPANGPRIASSKTIYVLSRIGSVVYVNWMTGYQ